MRRGVVVALCAVLVAGIIAGGAFAGGKGVTTTLTLENVEVSLYEGLVSSKKPSCEAGRQVSVFHDENDNGLDPSDYMIGSDRANLRGEYEVRGNQAPAGDTIIAEVQRRKLKKGKFCKAKTVDAIALRG